MLYEVYLCYSQRAQYTNYSLHEYSSALKDGNRFKIKGLRVKN